MSDDLAQRSEESAPVLPMINHMFTLFLREIRSSKTS
jgi:hypothetical protein